MSSVIFQYNAVADMPLVYNVYEFITFYCVLMVCFNGHKSRKWQHHKCDMYANAQLSFVCSMMSGYDEKYMKIIPPAKRQQ